MSSSRVRALFCDLHSLPKGKYIPSQVADGGHVGFAKGAFAVSLDRDLLTIPGTGVYEGLPDMELILDKQRRKSWQENTEIALGDLKAKGNTFGLCARSSLKKTINEFKSMDLNPKIGIELEAYVFERDSENVWRPYDTPGAFVYGTGPTNDPKGLMSKIWETAENADLPVESINGEYDNGQFELTLCFADALKACDDIFLFRTMAKEIAFQNDLILTFLPKPIPERGGSGLHVNFSFENKNKSNAIVDSGKLSTLGEKCISGLIHHHESLSALLASTVNSYSRLEPASMAGYWANWAEDHRLVTIRTSTSSPKSARIEHRTADGAANPYLAVNAILQAALLGIKNNYKLPKAEDLDGLENVRATRHVPSSFSKALEELEKDTSLISSIGKLLCDAYIVLKKDEVDRLANKSVDEIREYYLPFI